MWETSSMWAKYVWNPARCSCENGKYVASIMDYLANTPDEIIESEAKSNDEQTKTIPTNFNEKKATYKMQNCYNLLEFLSITIAL